MSTRCFFSISTKFDGVYVEVDERYTMVCHVARCKVKVKVTEVRNLRKLPISNCLSPPPICKRLMVNYDAPRLCPNFNRTDFWYSFSFASRDLQSYGVHDRQSLVRGLLILTVLTEIFPIEFAKCTWNLLIDRMSRNQTIGLCLISGLNPVDYNWSYLQDVVRWW